MSNLEEPEMAHQITNVHGPLVGDSAPAAAPRHPRLEDALGDVLRSYPLGFYAEALDDQVEREVLNHEILAGLVAP